MHHQFWTECSCTCRGTKLPIWFVANRTISKEILYFEKPYKSRLLYIHPVVVVGCLSRFVTINSTSMKSSKKVRDIIYDIFEESVWCWQPSGTFYQWQRQNALKTQHVPLFLKSILVQGFNIWHSDQSTGQLYSQKTHLIGKVSYKGNGYTTSDDIKHCDISILLNCHWIFWQNQLHTGNFNLCCSTRLDQKGSIRVLHTLICIFFSVFDWKEATSRSLDQYNP